jgi:hypothetical protein
MKKLSPTVTILMVLTASITIQSKTISGSAVSFQFPCGVHCTKPKTTNKFSCQGGGIYTFCWTDTSRTSCWVSTLCPGKGPGPILDSPVFSQRFVVQTQASEQTIKLEETLIREVAAKDGGLPFAFVLATIKMSGQDLDFGEFRSVGFNPEPEDVEALLQQDDSKLKELFKRKEALADIQQGAETVYNVKIEKNSLGYSLVILTCTQGNEVGKQLTINIGPDGEKVITISTAW